MTGRHRRPLMPGALEIGAQAAAAVRARADGGWERPRLCDEGGVLVARVDRIPQGARLVRWQGQVFEHWGGYEWRRVHVVDLGRE